MMPTLYPLLIALGLALAVLSFLLPSPSPAMVTRIVAVVLFIVAAILSVTPGLTT
jgi:hypothetical protein